VLGGLLVKGVISEGSNMKIGPMKDGSFKNVTIKSIHRNRVPCRIVRAGQGAALCLNVNLTDLRNGMVLISRNSKSSGCWYFQANISVLFHETAIYQGFETTVHIGSIRQTAIIFAIFAAKCIQTDDRASVLFKFKKYPEHVSVGQRLLFRSGASKGIGEITQIFPINCNSTG